MPWGCRWETNQVEFLTFTVTEPVAIHAVTMCKSARNDEPVTLEYFKVRRGGTTGSTEIYQDLRNVMIPPRNEENPSIVEFFRFQQGVPIAPYEKYTFEYKLSGASAILSGDSRTRPGEFYCFEDGILWEFCPDTPNTTGALINGSNHVAGPFVHFYYTKA